MILKINDGLFYKKGNFVIAEQFIKKDKLRKKFGLVCIY